MGWHEVLAHGVTHGGVISRRCCTVHGAVAPSTFDLRAARERWTPLLPGIYLLPGHTPTNVHRTVAAALSAGPETSVTGTSALALHGLLRAQPSNIDLLVPSHGHRIQLPKVRTHFSRTAITTSTTDVFGVPVADVARSLADRAPTAELPHLRAVAFDAMGQRLLRPADLRRELDERQRFPGRARYRQLASDLEGDGSDSGFEFDSRDRLTAAGLRPDDDQADVATRSGTRRLDIAYRDRLVAIDCLGFAYHSDASALERDAVRSNSIAALDRWLILLLTFRMFHLGWPAFLADLRTALDGRREHAWPGFAAASEHN